MERHCIRGSADGAWRRSAVSIYFILPMVLLFCKFAIVSAQGGPLLDDNWWNGFDYLRGANAPIKAVIELDGSPVIGGDFNRVSGSNAKYIAKWLGSSWVGFAQGLGKPPSGLTTFGGSLIAVTLDGVFAWNGVDWTDLNAPIEFAGEGFKSLLTYDDKLWIGTTQTLYTWDGISWDIPFEGIFGIMDLEVYRSELVVAGAFTQIDSVQANHIAIWDGIQLAALGTGLQGEPVEIFDMVVFGDTLIVAGQFGIAGGLFVDNVATWDGLQWRPFPGQNLLDLHVVDGALYAIKPMPSRVVRFNGNAWENLPNEQGSIPSPSAITSMGSTLLAVSKYEQRGATTFYDLAEWVEPIWTRMSPGIGAGLNASVAAFAILEDTLVVAGAFTAAGGQPLSPIAKWDGCSWRSLSSALTSINAMTVLDGELIVGGTFFDVNGVTYNNIARWDGHDWVPLGDGLYMLLYDEPFGSVTDLIIHNGTLIAVGQFDRSNGVLMPGVARWDGTSWNPIGPGVPAGETLYPHNVCSFGDTLIVSGLSLYGEGGYLRRWDGNTWSDVGQAVNAGDLFVYDGSLYATYLNFPSGTQMEFARWTGANWIYSAPYAGRMASYQGRLVVGNYTWDGATWEPLGSGVSGEARAMISYKGSLYAGGNFTSAGGKPSYYIARWDHWVSPVTVTAPNQFLLDVISYVSRDHPATIIYATPFERGRARLRIFDVRGRFLRTLHDGPLTSGLHETHWDGLDVFGVPVARGLYLVHYTTGVASSSKKVLVLR